MDEAECRVSAGLCRVAREGQRRSGGGGRRPFVGTAHDTGPEEEAAVVRKEMTNGEALADARIAEQAEAEKLLKDMERIGPDDQEWLGMFRQLCTAVLAHAEKEETLVLTPMGQQLSAERRDEVAGRYEKAKAMAPTHPHPVAPDTPPGNVALGPVAALVDRALDAMHDLAS